MCQRPELKEVFDLYSLSPRKKDFWLVSFMYGNVKKGGEKGLCNEKLFTFEKIPLLNKD